MRARVVLASFVAAVGVGALSPQGWAQPRYDVTAADPGDELSLPDRGTTWFIEPSGEQLAVDVTVGVEADSNAERQAGTRTERDVLSRYFVVMEASHRIGSSQGLSLKLRSGGKLYQRLSDENALLNQADLRYAWYPLSPIAQDWLLLYVSGVVKDRTEKVSNQDYIRGSATSGLGLLLGPVSLTAGGGWSLFVYKPDEDLSSGGPLVEGALQLAIGDDWRLTVAASRLFKDYEAPRNVLRSNGAVVPDATAERRGDTSDIFSAGIGYRGRFLVARLDGTALSNNSNSYGQSLRRFGGALTLTVPVWEVVILSGRASIQRTIYDDELFIDPTQTIDEDNRNAFVAAAEVELTEAVSIELRYSAYTQEFGSDDADYDRSLIFIGTTVGF